MKYIKQFESYNESVGHIKLMLAEYGITGCYVRNGIVDVNGDVNLERLDLVKIPFKFGKVTGDFNCSYNELDSLEGCPEEVGGNFYCYDNNLKDLVD